jgi:hypothetical protein
MKTEVVTVTPAIAEKALASSTSRNRSTSYGHVKLMAESMARGAWSLNGETIIFDDNGNILDGKHRLSAVVKSGCTVKMLFVRGVAPECFQSIDSGRKRTHGDILSIAGLANGKKIAAICGAIYTYEMAGDFAPQTSPARTILTNRNPNFDVVREVEKRMPEIQKSSSVADRFCKLVPCRISHSLIGAIHYILAQIDEHDAEKFFSSICNMEFTCDSDPKKRLFRSITVKGPAEIAKTNCRFTAAIFFKAWNACRQGKTCGSLRFFDNEDFPQPI